MTITIIRNTSSTDKWGNPLPPVPTTLYTGTIKEIDLQSFYPEKLEFKEDGSLKYKLKKLFLKNFSGIEINDEVRIDSEKYTVLMIDPFPKHKEVVLSVITKLHTAD